MMGEKDTESAVNCSTEGGICMAAESSVLSRHGDHCTTTGRIEGS